MCMCSCPMPMPICIVRTDDSMFLFYIFLIDCNTSSRAYGEQVSGPIMLKRNPAYSSPSMGDEREIDAKKYQYYPFLSSVIQLNQLSVIALPIVNCVGSTNAEFIKSKPTRRHRNEREKCKF